MAKVTITRCNDYGGFLFSSICQNVPFSAIFMQLENENICLSHKISQVIFETETYLIKMKLISNNQLLLSFTHDHKLSLGLLWRTSKLSTFLCID